MNILTQPLVLGVGFLVIGIGMGYIIRQLITQQRRGSLELEIKKLHLNAKAQAQEVILKSKEKASEIIEEAKHEAKDKELEFQRTSERLSRREEHLDKKTEEFENKQREKEKEQLTELEKVSRLSAEDAKKELVERVEKEIESDLAERIRKLEIQGEERFERKAKDILASVIQRLATSTAAEVTTTTVSIPSDDIKGKIIGKEGRNIRSLERAAGVEIIVDETPG